MERTVFNIPGDLGWLLNQPNTRLLIWDYEGESSVDAILNSETTLGGSSNWNNPDEPNFVTDLNKGYNVIRDVSSFIPGVDLASRNFKSPLSTVVDWKGSGDFSMTFNITLFAHNSEYDIRNDIYKLLEGVYPSIDFAGLVLTAPKKYTKSIELTEKFEEKLWGVAGKSGVKGCWGFSIGDWFEVDPIFVISNVSFQISREQTINNLPLMARGTVTFNSSRIIGIEDIKKWMRLS